MASNSPGTEWLVRHIVNLLPVNESIAFLATLWVLQLRKAVELEHIILQSAIHNVYKILTIKQNATSRQFWSIYGEGGG